MATNNPFENENQNWAQQLPPPPARSGMRTSTKVILILLIVFGGLALLCCGGGIATFVYFGKSIANSVSQDPKVVRQVTQQIAQISIPEALKPTASFDVKVPFTGQRMMTGVVYEDKASNSSLFLAVFGFQTDDVNREQMRRQMEQSFRQQGFATHADQPGNWESHSYEKQIEIRGQKVTFQFTARKNTETNDARIDVAGTFLGDEGTAMLALSANAKVVSEDQAVQMLQSIK